MKELLPALDDDMIKCVKCGMCHAHDAVYLTCLDESVGTRGHLMLISAAVRDGVEVGDGFIEKLYCSLNSYDPQTNCPTGTPVLKILTTVRQHLLSQHGVRKLADMFGARVLSAVNSSKSAKQRAALVAKVAAEELPPGNAWAGILAPLADAGALSSPTALAQLPEVSAGNGKGRVGYLLGSLVNHAAPQIARATVQLLNAAGYEVVTPKDQKCPGDLFATLGDLETAERLAQHNAELFGEFDTVVTSCAVTGAALKKGFTGEGSALSDKIKDVTELLADGCQPKGRIDKSVAYDDDCRLRAGQDVSAQPKALLSAAAGENFVTLPAADSASGGGDVWFPLLFAPIADKIAGKKVKSIIESKAEMVASGNVAAILHLNDALERAGAPARCQHTVEVLASAC